MGPRLRHRLLGSLLVLGLAGLAGCFAFDEIDAGMEKMDRFSSHKKEEAPTPPPAATADGGGGAPRPSLWESGRSLNPHEMDAEIARCQLGGGVQFMTRTDCLARGGRPG